MFTKLVQVFILCCSHFICFCQEDKIAFSILLPENYAHDSVGLTALSVEPLLDRNNQWLKSKVAGNKVDFTIYTTVPVQLFTEVLGNRVYLAEPGDEIVADITDCVTFGGRGAAKFRLVEELSAEESLERPQDLKKQLDPQNALKHYFNWYHYTAKLISRNSTILQRFREQVSAFAFLYLQSDFIVKVEDDLRDYFIIIKKNRDLLGLSGDSLVAIFDSTIMKSSFFKLGLHRSDTACLIRKADSQLRYRCTLMQDRNEGFPFKERRSLPSSSEASTMFTDLYYMCKQAYSGVGRMRTLQDIISKATVEVGMNARVKAIVDDFKSIAGFPEYKEWVDMFIAKKTKKMPTKLNDGPYVFYLNDRVVTKSIVATDGRQIVVTDTLEALQKRRAALQVKTGNAGRSFTVYLKNKLEVERCVYSRPRKLFAISDIEGNLTGFTNLLQANKVIDSKYNWTFGNGHLVIIGDVFDRGEQVTECLWLIYALEEKAKAKGGYVHYILGNHEIMNLNGRTSYVHPKYMLSVSGVLGEEYSSLYGKNNELGRWLRTKNIMEKIGNCLFVHGGISPAINKSEHSVASINQFIRPVYDAENYVRTNNDILLTTLFRSRTSPFWYRGYYKEEFQGYDDEAGVKMRADDSQVSLSLKKFQVSHIITGHTIVADTISTHYDNKIINTDTPHAEGKSEALLIEDTRFYRVNDKGKRWLLFDDAITK